MFNQSQAQDGQLGCLVSRRNFLLGGGTALATATIMIQVPGLAEAQQATLVRYPRKKIGSLKALKTDRPVTFNYPDNKAQSQTLLVKLGVEAGGGVGPIDRCRSRDTNLGPANVWLSRGMGCDDNREN